ncbi:MAG TPA: sugar phosphate nucleotidyltransferase [Acidimicrobiales bacterium]|nr:sugar phosphate nucleotidyltransferase [Acidimicrobiales bacterium]
MADVEAERSRSRSIPTVILCGGRGTRMAGYEPTLPKPLVPVGGRPILWHIMKIYAANGFDEFVLALGWLGEEIRRFVLDLEALTRDFTLDLASPTRIEFLGPSPSERWRITCKDTGMDTLTGTRVRRAMSGLEAERFMVTYGDCVGDVDINALMKHHLASGRLATVTAVPPPARFGELETDPNGMVVSFEEKPQTSSGAINGGFMVFEAEALDRYFPGTGDYMLEREPLSALARDGQLTAYHHQRFWQPMDTPRERELLEALWAGGHPPWKHWD